MEYNKLKLEQSLVDQIVKGEFSKEEGDVCGECTKCDKTENTQVDGETNS
jgi:predicted acetyltransferase